MRGTEKTSLDYNDDDVGDVQRGYFLLYEHQLTKPLAPGSGLPPRLQSFYDVEVHCFLLSAIHLLVLTFLSINYMSKFETKNPFTFQLLF